MTESVIYYNTHMSQLHSVTVTHAPSIIDGRSVNITRVDGGRGHGKTFTAQAIANYLMLNGATFVLVLDEGGEHYTLNGETGMAGHARHALSRHFNHADLTRLLLGRRDVHIVLAGYIDIPL